MSLKIKGWRRITSCLIWTVLAILFLVFLIRVATFESSYYSEKEGSERAVAATEDDDEEELIEVEPTVEEVHEYTVAADRPRYLSIEKLRISKARILPMGVNKKGEMDTPRNVFDVGWYTESGKPGQGKTMVIDGHNGGPNVHGVFKNLPNLVNGDVITVERGDGLVFRYEVVENKEIKLDEASSYMRTAMKSPVAGKESITLITCSGEWSQAQGTYLSRQFVRAVLITE